MRRNMNGKFYFPVIHFTAMSVIVAAIITLLAAKVDLTLFVSDLPIAVGMEAQNGHPLWD